MGLLRSTKVKVDAKQIFWSNILLIICCAFYLTWWLLEFKPTGAIKGINTGWLLIPASITGLVGVTQAVKGILSGTTGKVLFPSKLLIWGGIAAYLILMVVTEQLFKRQVTTELFLIIGWAVLVLLEINALYSMGRFSYGVAIIFAVVTTVAVVISLFCYVLYYNLGIHAGYIDGMIPLIITALVMAGISVAMEV